MNRRTLCIVLLAGYLLAACTMLSGKIQEEMTTLVMTVRRSSSKQINYPMTVDVRSVFQDSAGNHLYEVREGTGWDRGLRVRELKGFGLDIPEGIASYNGTGVYDFVRAASRQPIPGKLAKIVTEFSQTDDVYLYVYREESPTEWELPANCQVLGRTEHSLLVAVSGGTLPFLPHLAKTWTATTDRAVNVFSMAEVRQLLEQLPITAAVFAALFAGLVFWLCLCLSRDGKKAHAVMAMIGTLCVLFGLLRCIELPASMLPPANIFDLGYYREEFRVIVQELSAIPEADLSVMTLMARSNGRCIAVLAVSAAATLAAAVWILRGARRPGKKQPASV